MPLCPVGMECCSLMYAVVQLSDKEEGGGVQVKWTRSNLLTAFLSLPSCQLPCGHLCERWNEQSERALAMIINWLNLTVSHLNVAAVLALPGVDGGWLLRAKLLNWIIRHYARVLGRVSGLKSIMEWYCNIWEYETSSFENHFLKYNIKSYVVIQ